MKLLVVLNPIAGDTNKTDFVHYLKNTCSDRNIAYSFFETTGNQDLKKLRKKVEDYRPDKMIGVGGDGTFTLTAEASLPSGTMVGVIPLGSANGMARELGIEQDPEQAFQNFLDADTSSPMDMLCLNGEHYCIHLADVGLNAEMIKRYEKDDSRGMLTYARHLVQILPDLKQFDYSIEANGTNHSGACVMLAICNGRKFGTGVAINHDGNPFDGYFELIVIKEVKVGTVIKAGLAMFDDKFMDYVDKKVISTTHAELSFSEKVPFQADGEYLGETDKVTITMLKSKVNLLRSQNASYVQEA